MSYLTFERHLRQCLFLLTAVFLTQSCSGGDKKSETEVVPEVPVITLSGQDLPIKVEFVGQTKGAVDAAVRARVEGVIQTVDFKEGVEVKEGQLLYTIDPAPLQAKLAEAKARLAQAETQAAKAKSDLGRIRPLAEMKAVSARDLDSAVAQDGIARNGVEAAKAAVEAAEIDLSYTKIYAPVSGVIGLTKANVGEFVGKPPNAVVLNTVSVLDPIHVRFSVSENEYLYFARAKQKREKAGEAPPERPLELVLSDNSVHPEHGYLASVDSQIDPATSSLVAEASFPNPGKILRPGQFAKIRTVREVSKGAITIPKKAIRELQGLKQVMTVDKDNKVEVKNVSVKEEVGDIAVIETGLTAGDRIIPEVRQRLTAGTLVKPTEAAKASL